MKDKLSVDEFTEKMKNQFVPVELAIKLKELGFNDPCFGYFDIKGLNAHKHPKNPMNLNSNWVEDKKNTIVSAPIYQQVFEWFRMVHEIDIYPMNYKNGYTFIINQNKDNYVYWRNKMPYSYDKARDICIKKLINILKN
ncbi:MAG: hypothetical protein ACOC3V_00785 [bacterium]